MVNINLFFCSQNNCHHSCTMLNGMTVRKVLHKLCFYNSAASLPQSVHMIISDPRLLHFPSELFMVLYTIDPSYKIYAFLGFLLETAFLMQFLHVYRKCVLTLSRGTKYILSTI